MNKTNKKFKDPGSAITHLIAMIGAVICAFPLSHEKDNPV